MSTSLKGVSRVFVYLLISLGFHSQGVASKPPTLRAKAPVRIPLTADHWTTVLGRVEFVDHLGKPSIHLLDGDYTKHISEGTAALKAFSFHNGTVEYDVAVDNGMGAGFVFRRADENDSEMFYLRPQAKCEQTPECIQYAPQVHGVLLWDLFPQYQAPAPLHLGEWNHVKLVISGKRMNIYVNGAKQPTLRVGRLQGDSEEGGLMLVGPGYFTNLIVTPDAVGGLPGEPEPDPTASDSRYIRYWRISEASTLPSNQTPTITGLPPSAARWTALRAEQSGLVNASRVYGMPMPRPSRSLVWLKTTIQSSTTQQKHVSVGWAREIFVFANGKLVYSDKNLFQPPEARKMPNGRVSVDNGSFSLPLKAGVNELAVAVVNNFYGWGLIMRLDDMKNLEINHE